MNNSKFSQFENDIKSLNYQIELHKIMGSYCYLIKYDEFSENFDNNLNEIIKIIEEYAKYKINISNKQIL